MKTYHSGFGAFFTKAFFGAVAVAAATSLTTPLTAVPLTGAIFTTDSTCSGTDLNLYDSKDAVYIDGGPAHLGAAGLPDGDYYVKVTEPDGTLLGTSIGAPVHVTNGEFDICYQLSAILVKASDASPGYDDTTNPGGEYKVWISPTSDFESQKTDNFKVVDDGGTEIGIPVQISGTKYCDANGNGVVDAGETGLAGWTININYVDPTDGAKTGTATTDANGHWTFTLPSGSTLNSVAETNQSGWLQTGPLGGTYTGPIVISANTGGFDFLNVRASTICVTKFYDANANHVMDGAEVGITGWKITLVGVDSLNNPVSKTDYTGVAGGVCFNNLLPGTYTVAEALSITGSWVATTPTEVDADILSVSCEAEPSPRVIVFGNVCLGAGGGLTLGFWSNKNGQALITGPDLSLLQSLNLVDAAGNVFDPLTNSSFRTWVLSATATNMAYMLSAQLATMELNVFNGFVNQNALVYNACSNTFVSIGSLMTAANTSLGLYPNTLVGDSHRTDQECLKTTLDQANNNLNFVQGAPCAFSFAVEP